MRTVNEIHTLIAHYDKPNATKKHQPGLNFTNIFTLSFYARRSQKHKKTDNLSVFFTLLGSTHVKAVRRTFMKFSPDVTTTCVMDLDQACTTYGLRAKCGLRKLSIWPTKPKFTYIWLDF